MMGLAVTPYVDSPNTKVATAVKAVRLLSVAMAYGTKSVVTLQMSLS
jgi:hypothetical protein